MMSTVRSAFIYVLILLSLLSISSSAFSFDLPLAKWVKTELVPTITGKRPLKINPKKISINHKNFLKLEFGPDHAFARLGDVTLKTGQLRKRLLQAGCVAAGGGAACAPDILAREQAKLSELSGLPTQIKFSHNGRYQIRFGADQAFVKVNGITLGTNHLSKRLEELGCLVDGGQGAECPSNVWEHVKTRLLKGKLPVSVRISHKGDYRLEFGPENALLRVGGVAIQSHHLKKRLDEVGCSWANDSLIECTAEKYLAVVYEAQFGKVEIPSVVRGLENTTINFGNTYDAVHIGGIAIERAAFKQRLIELGCTEGAANTAVCNTEAIENEVRLYGAAKQGYCFLEQSQCEDSNTNKKYYYELGSDDTLHTFENVTIPTNELVDWLTFNGCTVSSNNTASCSHLTFERVVSSLDNG